MNFKLMMMMALLPTAALAEEVNDTTIVVDNRQIVVGDSAGLTRVRVYNADGTECFKTFEGHYGDGKEQERFFFTSPFYSTNDDSNGGSMYMFGGLSMFPSHMLGFSNADDMHVNTWKSYEGGFSFTDMGFWLNKRHTCSVSLKFDFLFNSTRFKANNVMEYDDDGRIVVADKGVKVVKNHFISLQNRAKLMVNWYHYDLDHNRDVFSLGISLDATGYDNYSAYEYNGRHFAPAAGLSMRRTRFGIDMEIGGDHGILYIHQSLTPLFSSGKGPKCYPLSIGLGVKF